MSDSPRVVKIGGSLLGGDDPAGRLRGWLTRQNGAPPVLVVGGGALVDALRRLDAAAPLDQAEAHWLAIDLMAVNARVVAAWTGAPVVGGRLADLAGAVATHGGGPVVFDPRRFLREEEPRLPGPRLPIGWETTSDSIAARLAAVLGVDLLLLKSPPPPSGCRADDWRALAAHGYVDAAFSAVVGGASSVAVESLGPSAG